MGGFGSGRSTGRSTTRGYRSLDVRELHRQGRLKPGVFYALKWERAGEVLASIGIRTEADRLILDYRHYPRDADPQDERYPVYLDNTPCTYGGERPWFLCPVAGCGQRVALLYLGHGGIFACRHCYRLSYQSQRETDSDRAFRRAEAIRRRLGWIPGTANPHGDKPKGMHWHTFERLVAEHDAHANKAWAGLSW